MSNQKSKNTAPMAVAAAILGAAAILLLVIISGPEKWIFAGAAAVAMLAFLVPVLRGIRSGGGR